MSAPHRIVIAGAGGMGSAVGLLLREMGDAPCDLWLGDAAEERAAEAAAWLREGSSRPGAVVPFHLPPSGSGPELERALDDAELLLDCLPGEEAVRMARLARRHDLHYANLTEHVAATDAIRREIAPGAPRGFLLQTGLAPGVVNVLGHGLFRRFCREQGVERADSLAMRVGALTANAQPPHYYAFTWNSHGVATEYVKHAIVVRDGARTTLPSLSERAAVLIGGVLYEEDLTSGGAADLPEALAGRVRHLDYKTLRWPGHYGWVDGILEAMPPGADPVEHLHAELVRVVPRVEDDDLVVVYAAVQGRDAHGILHRLEIWRRVPPFRCGPRTLRAIQATTAAGMAESARLLLTGRHAGPVLQSQIDPESFLSGPFVGPIYGLR
ncbi:MAG TPA: saccharopine dehydrogenase C-terminal domain-containing protein [Thermoanaerobaculia bacterium]|nr:saccharopine dehydrogenase C-terminal domain-containing protein [Thermoanaerobaculia bacterium]